MAMTGVRRVSLGLGLVEEPPPEELFEEGAPEILERIPPDRRAAAIELGHWAFGAGAGAMFALLPPGIRRRAGAGPAYGLAIWILFEAVVQPIVDTPHAHRANVGERVAIGADHLLYGLILGERFPPKS